MCKLQSRRGRKEGDLGIWAYAEYGDSVNSGPSFGAWDRSNRRHGKVSPAGFPGSLYFHGPRNVVKAGLRSEIRLASNRFLRRYSLAYESVPNLPRPQKGSGPFRLTFAKSGLLRLVTA